MRNLVLVKARLARGGMLAIGQSASEPEPHRVRSRCLAIGADDLDARGRSPMCCQRTRPSLGGEAEGRSLGFISIIFFAGPLTQVIRSARSSRDGANENGPRRGGIGAHSL